MRNRVIMAFLVNVCRLLVALTFIFSGYVKAIDPLGTQYKIQDYLSALGVTANSYDYLILVVAVFLGALEFCLGIYLLFAIYRRAVSRVLLLFMSLMTLVSLWLVIFNPITDCGCFGDAVALTNTQTLIKNIILLLFTLFIVYRPEAMFRFVGNNNQWIVANYTIVFILFTSSSSLYLLPQFDFRPYHVGADIKKGMEIPANAEQPKFETTFILEKDGVRKEFSLNDYPDSTWTFIDSKTVQTSKGYVPEIHDFSIQSIDGTIDITEEVLNNKGYVFLFVSPDLRRANDTSYGEIDDIYNYCERNGYMFCALTAGDEKSINYWRDITGAEYTFYNTDETTLKTMIRSNPGLILLKNGVVIGKWSHNNLPELSQTSPSLEKTEYGVLNPDSTSKRITSILLWYILPLIVLSLADRMWNFTSWIRRKKQSNVLYNFFKKGKKMRKKIVAGNWKMNMNLQEGIALAKEINETLVNEKPACDVIICTPFIHLASVAQILDQSVVGLGAENCADKEKGAYTGEVSAEMVKSTGAQYVILGHSERRGYYGETPEILKEKVALALKNNLKVIFCIGESLEEREAGKQNEVVKAELEGSVFNLNEEEFKNVIIAYEPIWAIGTGKTATSEQAEEIHAYIRGIIAERYGKAVADETSILYGGSCKASNAPELFAKPDIDGGLIGGASLKAADFMGIIKAW